MQRLKKILGILFFLTTNSLLFAQVTVDFSKINNIETEEHIHASVKITPANQKKITAILLLAIDVSVDNLYNEHTTRNFDGHPYYYKYIRIKTSDYDFEILEKKNTKFIYDPAHPDALMKGTKKGYVEYPDIDAPKERDSIGYCLQILRQLLKE